MWESPAIGHSVRPAGYSKEVRKSGRPAVVTTAARRPRVRLLIRMASPELSRRVEKVVGYPPLSELNDLQRREFHEALLEAATFEICLGGGRRRSKGGAESAAATGRQGRLGLAAPGAAPLISRSTPFAEGAGSGRWVAGLPRRPARRRRPRRHPSAPACRSARCPDRRPACCCRACRASGRES
jgi:hypothetical protein